MDTIIKHGVEGIQDMSRDAPSLYRNDELQ